MLVRTCARAAPGSDAPRDAAFGDSMAGDCDPTISPLRREQAALPRWRGPRAAHGAVLPKEWAAQLQLFHCRSSARTDTGSLNQLAEPSLAHFERQLLDVCVGEAIGGCRYRKPHPR